MRIRTLDAVRGLAALSVMFFHCSQLYPESVRFHVAAADPSSWLHPWAWFRYTPLHLIVLGQPAVILFFVLSGYVLTLPFLADAQPAYPSYLVKRICRLYLPFLVAVLASAALYAVIAPTPLPALGRDLTSVAWTHSIGVRDVLAHLAMTGLTKDEVLDAPMWSLVHELRISIIFPLLVMLAARGVGRAVIFAVLFFLVCSYGVHAVGEETLAGTMLSTGTCVLFFVAGIALALRAERWQHRLGGLDPRLRLLLWGGSLAALLFPGSLLPWARLFWVLGSVGILSLCLSSPSAQNALGWGPLQWLGRISFSLYLLHMVVLLSLVHLLYGRVPLLAIVLAVPPLSLAAAALMYRYVEEPARQLGRRIAAGQWRLAASPRAAE